MLENEISNSEERLGGDRDPLDAGFPATAVLVLTVTGTVVNPAAFKASCDMDPI